VCSHVSACCTVQNSLLALLAGCTLHLECGQVRVSVGEQGEGIHSSTKKHQLAAVHRALASHRCKKDCAWVGDYNLPPARAP
jgi:hypothetical protein